MSHIPTNPFIRFAMNFSPVTLSLLLLCGAVAQAAEAPANCVYKRVAGRELTLQIVRPADWQAGDHRPALVLFHGGGWVNGAPSQFAPQAEYFASRGLVCLLVEYRLLEKSSKEPPLVCVQDAKSAMRWVRTHAASLGIDPRRIGAGGGSAGGHLAAFAGLVEGLDDPQDDLSMSAKPAALLLFNPVLDNGPENGWGRERVGNRYPEFSPAHNIGPDDPPTLVMLGTHDRLIPVAVIERFRKGMTTAGVRCETRYYEEQGHGFFNYKEGEDNRYFHETLRAADDFLVSLGWLPASPAATRP